MLKAALLLKQNGHRDKSATSASRRRTNQGKNTSLDPPLYFHEGDSIPETVDPELVIVIKRVYVDPPEHGDEVLPEEPREAAADVFGAESKRVKAFNRPVVLPYTGVA